MARARSRLVPLVAVLLGVAGLGMVVAGVGGTSTPAAPGVASRSAEPSPVGPEPGHRLIRLPLDGASAAPAAVGAVVDVLAAVADAAGGGRVVAVASGRVVSLDGAATVTLDVDSDAAARLLWAQSFAKSLRVLARASPDDPPPSGASGPGG